MIEFWIAREKNGVLYLYKDKPIYVQEQGYWRENQDINEDYFGEVELPKRMFPKVTFENSPQQVEIKIIKKKSK